MDGVLGTLRVRIVADYGQFKASMSKLTTATAPAKAGMTGLAAANKQVSVTATEAAINTEKLGAVATRTAMQTAGLGKYGGMMSSAFKGVSPALKNVSLGLKTMGASFSTTLATTKSFPKALAAMNVGLKSVSLGFKALGVAILVAMGPLIGIMVAIEVAMWLWNRHKERQEQARKEMEATELAVKSLGVTMDQANKSVKQYGTSFASISQQMVAWGHSSSEAIMMTEKILTETKKLADYWKVSQEDLIQGFLESIQANSEGLENIFVVWDDAQLRAYALEKGIIGVNDAWDDTAKQMAVLYKMIEVLNSGPQPGLPMSKSLLEAAKAAEKARKNIGLMSFDALNTIKKQDEQSSKFSWSDMFSNIVYDADAVQEAYEDMNEELKQQVTVWEAIAKVFGISYTTSRKIGDYWHGFKTTMGDVWAGIKDVGGDAWATVKTAGEGAWIAIKTAGGNAWGAIKGFGETAWTAISNFGGQAWTTIKDTGIKAFNFITDELPKIFSGAIDKILEFFGNLWRDIKNGFANMINDIPILGSVARGLGSIWGGIKDVTGLASGGAVMPNNPGIVKIGDNTREPEIVAPQSYIRQAVVEALSQVGGGGTQTIQLTVNLDGATVARQIVRPLTQEQARLGLV